MRLKSILVLGILLGLVWVGAACAQSVTVDYSTTTSAIPQIFAVNGLPPTTALVNATAGVGIGLVRDDYYMTNIVPSTTTLSAYQSAMAAGCPSGSVCDPNTWNWTRTNTMQAARNLGFKVLGIMDTIPQWDSSTGNEDGQIIDYTSYDDIVTKIVRHFMADYIEIGQESDGCGPFVMCLNPTQYATYYAQVAKAIRSVSSSVPLGGPVTAIPGHTDYVDAMGANPSILPNYVNFISQHSYSPNYTSGNLPNFSTAMLNEGKKFWPNVVGFVSEWNANGQCTSSTLNNNDPSTPGWVGANLIAALATGQNAIYFDATTTPDGSGCAWFNDAETALLPKDYAWEVMRQIGLNAGTGSVKSTAVSRLSEAVGMVNSAGKPVVALANWFSPVNVTVTLNKLSLSGTVGVTVYMADFTTNNGTSAFSTFNVNVVGGSTTFTVPMTADSTAGVILEAVVGVPILTPTGTAVPTATLTPLPGVGGDYLIGSTYVIDGGFYTSMWGFPAAAEAYQNNQPNPSQQYVVAPSGTGFTICNYNVEKTSGTPVCLTDGGTVVDQGQGNDVWTIASVGSQWTLQNQRTGKYMGAVPSVSRSNIPMSITPVSINLGPG